MTEQKHPSTRELKFTYKNKNAPFPFYITDKPLPSP